MQFIVIASAIMATADAARNGNTSPPCNSGLLYSSVQCCKTSVLGLASLDCKPASRAFSGLTDFKTICSVGRSLQCCSILVAGIGLLCQDVAV
ncbi:hypothetical protein HIM_08383 [Hirsutella minnesotensis 3608]|uniref:Hydrophobin n=1 Tax=Hirsutella minnesotensis 3608 TaxID=1043627 RepID=A0A0F7ZH93_9HYPO|nr:hypothetical protein HIM_08383 [Hirsutella minnesotensis 3608]